MTFSVRQTTREKFDCFDLSFNSSMVLRIHMVRRTLMKSMFISFFVVLLLSMLFPGCLCLGSDTILAGQSLFPNQTIISQGGIFELGFFSPGKSTNYYVGIWYKKISVRTVVWVANRNNPISYSLYDDSRLEMLNDGNLRLIGNSKTNWVLETSYATDAVILDTGNFALRNASGIIIWQSFDYPTDTLLPGGKVGLRLFSDIETKLVSWSNPEDPGIGNFSLGMQSDGFSELFIKRNDFKLWRSGVLQGGNFSVLPHFFNFTYVSKGDSVYLVYNVFNSSLISKIKLTYGGVMQQSVWSEGRQSWSTIWSEPSDACRSYAMCGSNAICDIRNMPTCSCLTGFEPKVVNDWDRFDFSSGCVRKQPKCSDENDFFKFSNIRLPENPESLAVIRPKICELACGSSCSCNAYAYSTEGGCLLFNGELLDLERLSNNSAGRDLYIRMDTALSLSSSRGKGNLNVPRLALVLPFSVIFVLCIILLFCFWRKRKNKVSQPGADLAYQNLLLLNLSSNGPENNKRPAERTNGSGEEKNNKYELPTFSFSSIVEATNDFSITNKLGEGGFGPVYKGELLNEQFVAVKRLSRRSGQGLEEFKNETELIAKLQHKNLVGILGCCIENEEKILIYEYMPNQSLDIFLFDPTKKEQLDLARRVHIIEGIAQGLLYLHHYSRLRIIHRDLKASNVLLDAEMNPKISDFGMARIFGGTDLQANTKRIVGTYGYMSPEYAMGGIFSIKSDVYAFGVLLLEILSGKKNTGFYDSDYLSLLGYAWNMWTNNRGLDLVDPSVEIISSSSSVVLRYIQIALLCVQENPGDRPTMLDVVAMFNKEQKAVASPKHPAFSVGGTLVKASPGGNKLEICSVNGLTVSVMEAR